MLTSQHPAQRSQTLPRMLLQSASEPIAKAIDWYDQSFTKEVVDAKLEFKAVERAVVDTIRLHNVPKESWGREQ